MNLPSARLGLAAEHPDRTGLPRRPILRMHRYGGALAAKDSSGVVMDADRHH